MLLRKILWTAVITVLCTASAALAALAAERLWSRFGTGPPPPMPRWAKLLVGRPLKKGVAGRIHEVPV